MILALESDMDMLSLIWSLDLCIVCTIWSPDYSQCCRCVLILLTLIKIEK